MDEINYGVCSSSNSSIGIGEEGRLMDRRDGKIYWVAKLKDGLCWMTQNLDYDGGGTFSTSFESTDVTNNVAKYYDPGEYAYTKEDTSTKCGSLKVETGGLGACASWKTFDKNLLYVADLDVATAQELHYSIGNYYNWLAATNGTGLASITRGSASGSVCPVGWSLPIGNTAEHVDGTFSKLIDEVSGTIAKAPYYFVYGGQVVGENGLFSGVGEYGHYWSNWAGSSDYANSLLFTSNSTSVNGINQRAYGYSVRCVAR